MCGTELAYGAISCYAKMHGTKLAYADISTELAYGAMAAVPSVPFAAALLRCAYPQYPSQQLCSTPSLPHTPSSPSSS
eukprot:2632282-Rhodomonas_salina.1